MSHGSRGEEERRSLVVLTALALLGALAIAWNVAAPLNHDVAWIMQGADRLLDGGLFGRDIVDLNPPLA